MADVNLEALVDKLAEKAGLAADMVAPLAGDLVKQYEIRCLVYIMSNAVCLVLFSIGLFLLLTEWGVVFTRAIVVTEAGNKLDMKCSAPGGRMMAVGVASICFYIIGIVVSFIGILVLLGDIIGSMAGYVSPLVGLLRIL